MHKDVEKLARLITFLPYNLVEDVVVHGRALEPSVWWEEGCLLSAELSVVPPRHDRRTAHAVVDEEVSRAGAELGLALRRILESCVFPRGGYLLKFSANGVLVMFTRRCPGAGVWPWSSTDEDVAPPEHRAARCGLELLAVLKEVLPHTFTVRAGVETGRFRLALCGHPGQRMEQLALGTLCRTVAHLRDVAGPGELVAGPQLLARLTGLQAHIGPMRQGGRRLVNMPPEAAGPPARVADLSDLYRPKARALADTLRVLLPPDVAERALSVDASVLHGEVRPVAMATFPLDVNDADELDDSALMLDLNAGVTTLLDTVAEFGGLPLHLDVLAGGSAAVAAFGVKDTLRHASQDAVACALKLATRFSAEKSRWVIRGAVEAGRAYVGELGSPLKREVGAVGGPAVVSRDLAAHAAPGQVLVGETAWRMCGARVLGRSIGQFAVGNPPRSWPVYEATATRAAPLPDAQPALRERSDDDAGGESPRVRLRERLERLLSQALHARQGGAVVLYGPEASGKTEVLQRLADDAAEVGFRGAMARCPRNLTQQPPSALALILRDLLGIPRSATAEQCHVHVRQELVAALGADARVPGALWSWLGVPQPPVPPPPPSLDGWPDAESTLQQWLTARAQHAPLLLALEDVHHADAQTLAVLIPLMRAAPRLPLVIVCTATHDPEHGTVMGQPIISALHRCGARWFPVPPLDTPETLELLARELAVPDPLDMGLEPEALAAGMARLGGQMRVIREVGHLIRTRLAQGWLLTAAWTEATEAPLSSELWQLKLDALPAEQRQLLRLASVLGLEFEAVGLWRTLQAGFVGGTLGTMMSRLSGLVGARVLAPALVGGVVGYRFQSALMRDVAYQSLPAPERTRWHGHAARALIGSPWTDGGAGPGRTAHHLALGPNPGEAVSHLMASAKQLRELGCMEQAAQQLESALPLAGGSPPEERRLLHLELARLQLALGDHVAADRTASAVTDDVAAPVDERARGWAYRTVAALRSDDGGGAVLASQTGRRLVSKTSHVALRTWLGALHVDALWRYGEGERARLFYEQVHQQVTTLATPLLQEQQRANTELELAHAGALAAVGRGAEARDRLEALLARLEQLPLDVVHGMAWHRLGACLMPDEPHAAARAFHCAVDLLDAVMEPMVAVDARLHAARAWLRAQDLAAAQRLLEAVHVRAHLVRGARSAMLAILDAQVKAKTEPRAAQQALDKARPDLEAASPRWRTMLWLEMSRALDALGQSAAADDARNQARESAERARAPDLLRTLENDVTAPR